MRNNSPRLRQPSLAALSRSIFNPETLPRDLAEELFQFLVRGSPAQAASLCCASKVLRQRLEEVLKNSPELNAIMRKARDEHVEASLEDAKEGISHNERALYTTLWLGSSLIAALEIMGNSEECSALLFLPPVLMAYSVAAFSAHRTPDAAKVLRLMFDFSLSYAGNVFVTVQVNSAQSLVALMIAVTSTVHALVLSLLMMSASVQASLWRELDSSLHKTQSVIMLFFYIAITMYYGGIPGVWKLSSACSRIFMLIHFSWTWILPKLGETGNGNPDGNNDDVIGDLHDNGLDDGNVGNGIGAEVVAGD